VWKIPVTRFNECKKLVYLSLQRCLKPARILLVVVTALLILSNSRYAFMEAKQLKTERSVAARLLPFESYIDPATDISSESCMFPLFPVAGSTGWFRWYDSFRNQLGFSSAIKGVSFNEQLAANGAFEPLEQAGQSLILKKNDIVHASGWVKPGQTNQPWVVFLSYGDQRTFITGTITGSSRPDLAKVMSAEDYGHAGWTVEFPASFLPAGATVLKAWAFDPAHNQFFRLADSGPEKRVTVEGL